MNIGPAGLVFDIAVAVVFTAVGSVFAAGDAALSEIPEGRRQALSAEGSPAASAFRRFVQDPTGIIARWLVGRIVAITLAAMLLGEAARIAGIERYAIAAAVLGISSTAETALTRSAHRNPARLQEPARELAA